MYLKHLVLNMNKTFCYLVGGIRVCTYCGKVAMSALQAEPEGNLHVEREDLGLSIDSDSGIWGTKKLDGTR